MICCEVIDDTDSLAHEVHEILWIGTTKVVLSENGSNALSENQTSIWDSMLVSQDNTNLRGAHTLLRILENQGFNLLRIRVGPSRRLAHERL